MPVKIHLLVISLLFSLSAFAQMPHIHVESVGEWELSQQLTPDYRYNSVGVYLINEKQLASLFDPNKLSREERKKTGVKTFDKVESLFFQLDLPNPKNEEEVLSFPLYAFDIQPTTAFKSPRTQGKILDRITDEELNGRGLDATARIEMVHKNELLEVAYKISSNINKLLGNRVFETFDFWKVMQKAQLYFEERYKGQMVAEFSVPILPESEEYEYVIESASLYQIKWNFQDKIDAYKNNVWSDLRSAATVSEEELLDRPARLSKLKKHPYLLVVRYKSAYAIPKEQQLNVALTEEYLHKRRYNLQEFKTESIQYRTEETFTQLIQKALALKQSVATYLAAKAKGQMENEQLLAIPQHYYDICAQYQQATKQIDEAELAYIEEVYGTTYFKFFKQLDQLLIQDPQIQAVAQAPRALQKWEFTSQDSLSTALLYQQLDRFSAYQEVRATAEQVKGDLPILVEKEIQQIEQVLFSSLLSEAPYTQEEKLLYLKGLTQQFPLCTYCLEQSDKQVSQLEHRMEEEIRAAFLSLQNQQLKYGRCFADLQKKATLELEEQFPNPSSEEKLYTVFKDKITTLGQVSTQFMKIADIAISQLSVEEVGQEYRKYNQLLSSYQQHICQLLHGAILAKEEVQCVTAACKMEIP